MKARFLKLSFYNLVVVFPIFCFCCSNRQRDKEYGEIKKHIEDTYNIKTDKGIERIVFINDNGCSNCTQSFSNYVLDNMNDEKTLVIVNSRGSNVDLDKFIEKRSENKHIILSLNPRESDSKIPDLGVVYVNNEKIDTILTLIPEKLREQMEYIDKRE